MFKGVAHALFEERRLQSAPAHLGNCSGTGQQSDSVMNKKRSGGARLAVELGEKTRTLPARRRNDADLEKEIAKFRMFV
jgi:hypothetical protein